MPETFDFSWILVQLKKLKEVWRLSWEWKSTLFIFNEMWKTDFIKTWEWWKKLDSISVDDILADDWIIL